MGVGRALESGGEGEREEGEAANWLMGEAGLGWLKAFLKTLVL